MSQRSSKTSAGAASTHDSAESLGGIERRRHRVFVTRNTEYHVRDNLCVAVRDRRSGDFLRGHLARGRSIHGGLRFAEGAIVPHVGTPEPGDALYFAAGGRDLVTSSLIEVTRPSKEMTSAYPHETDESFAFAFGADGDARFDD